jgi:hypothetical protein
MYHKFTFQNTDLDQFGVRISCGELGVVHTKHNALGEVNPH